MDSLCHPWFTTTNLSYSYPIFETSATALRGTTGNILFWDLPVLMPLFCSVTELRLWCWNLSEPQCLSQRFFQLKCAPEAAHVSHKHEWGMVSLPLSVPAFQTINILSFFHTLVVKAPPKEPGFSGNLTKNQCRSRVKIRWTCYTI